MGMVFAQAVAYDTRALTKRLVGLQAQFIHRVKDAAVNGFQAVPHVRQGAVNNDRHGIRNEALLHFGFQLDWYDPVDRHRRQRRLCWLRSCDVVFFFHTLTLSSIVTALAF
ncbi:hypothetical protein SDC9_135854 [bioreactor metagenome]|uniref:Uncharacterized protein n=1 Tax=bioreactor metagenome TaxID=1076179 RepID=A0A645DGZ8_9ZZZZ